MRQIVIGSILIIVVGFMVFLYQSIGNDPQKLPSTLIGKPLPEFSADKLGTEENEVATILTNEDIQGPALVNVWATWCPTCEAEHGVLNVLKNRGVLIYGLNYKDDTKLAYKWLKQLGNPYKLTVSDTTGLVGIELGVYGAPETFFLDENNVILYRHVGAITQEDWDTTLKYYYRGDVKP